MQIVNQRATETQSSLDTLATSVYLYRYIYMCVYMCVVQHAMHIYSVLGEQHRWLPSLYLTLSCSLLFRAAAYCFFLLFLLRGEKERTEWVNVCLIFAASSFVDGVRERERGRECYFYANASTKSNEFFVFRFARQVEKKIFFSPSLELLAKLKSPEISRKWIFIR